MPNRILLAVFLVALFLPLAAFAAPAAPGWGKAEKDLRADWKKKYAAEKIVSVAQNGKPDAREEGEPVIKRYLAYPFQVTVKKGGDEKLFEVSANYVSTRGGAYSYTGISVGAAIDKTAQKAKPDKATVKKMALEAFKAKYPENTYENIKLDDGEAGKSGDRVWVRYTSDVDRTDAEGKKITCKDGSFSIEKKTPDAEWVVEVDSDGKCR